MIYYILMQKPDLSMSEIDNPSCWCDSGHLAKGTFKVDSTSNPIRFFKIESKKISGIFCEPCLTLANFIKNNKVK